ncbi:MAG: FecR domain-containing protein [Acidobacteriota bacterium]
MSDDYLWDRTGVGDPEIADLERVLGSFRPRSRPPFTPGPRSLPTPRRVPVAGLALLLATAATVACAVGWLWIARPAGVRRLVVTSTDGEPLIGGRRLGTQSELSAGHWLVTDNHARARVLVGDVGRLDVEPNTRLALSSAESGRYRMRLAAGTVRAFIWSPPGQFIVDTDGATVVDLGCAFTLTVGQDGSGLVVVASGWVGFESQGRESFVPAGAVCAASAAAGPGLPHFEDRSPAFLRAIDVIDSGRGSIPERSAAFDRVIEDSRQDDAVTLWHLLTRVDRPRCDRVFDQLASFVPAPAGVTREGIRAGDHAMLDRWWQDVRGDSQKWWATWQTMFPERSDLLREIR